MTRDEHKVALHDMMQRRDALEKAIFALAWALDSGAISDPPQGANVQDQPTPESPEERQQREQERTNADA